MVGLGDQDPAEARAVGRLGAVVELQLVHALEVEREAAGRAVDLDPDGVLAAGGEPGGLERGQRAPGEPARNSAASSTVTGARSAAGRRREPSSGRLDGRALLDERLGSADTRDDLAGDVLGQVDDVRADVAERAGAGLVLLQPPHQRELGSTIQSCRYCARTCRISPIRPVGDQLRASAIAGTRR